MAYILIAVLIGFSSQSSLNVEFKSKAACMAAAEQLQRQVNVSALTNKGNQIIFCTPKDAP